MLVRRRNKCQCGCGQVIKSDKRFFWGHNVRGTGKKYDDHFCECGCGGLTKPKRRFIHGHNGLGSNNGMYGRRKPPKYYEPKFCACGCGEYVKRNNNYLAGHYMNGRVSTNKGRTDIYSEKSRKAMADAKLGLRGEQTNRYHTKTSAEGIENFKSAAKKRVETYGPPFAGHHHKEKSKKVISEKLTGIKRPEGVTEKIIATRKKNKPSITEEERICACGCGETFIVYNCIAWKKSTKKFIHGHSQRGKERPQDVKDKCRESGKQYWDELTEEERNERIKIWARSQRFRPNKVETYLLDVLNNLYPNEWKYTGDFSFVINGRSPDFTNVNGKKKLIELFGDYWHKGDDPKARAEIFKPFGYDTLVIWEHELKNQKDLESKIKRFNNKY